MTSLSKYIVMVTEIYEELYPNNWPQDTDLMTELCNYAYSKQLKPEQIRTLLFYRCDIKKQIQMEHRKVFKRILENKEKLSPFDEIS